MRLEKKSSCKINLLLNILGKRADGFHELETVMYPVSVHDQLTVERTGSGIHLSCNDPLLPTNSKNLVYRAAMLFLKTSGANDGLRIHLHKEIPIAAGLGAEVATAATTLLALNELFDCPLENSEAGWKWPRRSVPTISVFSAKPPGISDWSRRKNHSAGISSQPYAGHTFYWFIPWFRNFHPLGLRTTRELSRVR